METFNQKIYILVIKMYIKLEIFDIFMNINLLQIK